MLSRKKEKKVQNERSQSSFHLLALNPYTNSHSFIQSFIHSINHSLFHSFIHSFIYLFIHSFIHSFIHPIQKNLRFIHPPCAPCPAYLVPSQEIAVTMLITANHRGWVQFSLCGLKNESAVETEDCFSPLTVNEDADRRPFWGDDLSTKFKVPEGVTGSMDVKVQLPKGKSCDHCVLRWFYSTGELNRGGPV